MSIWFEGSGEIKRTLEQVKRAFEDLGEHYAGVVRRMPGLSSVELVEQGPDFVIIKTSEGLMRRTNICKSVEEDQMVVEFDERYEAGSAVTTTSHFRDEFVASETGVTHHVVVSELEAPGLLGFFYRKFGRGSMGKAFLHSYKTYFEERAGARTRS